MRRLHPLWLTLPCLLLVTAGCRKQAPPETTTDTQAKPAGRLVPAVVAGYERGLGGWQVEWSQGNGAAPTPVIVYGEASRGDNWLAIPLTPTGSGEAVVDVWGNVPAGNWLRFGDTVRADVRIAPGGVKVDVQPYLVTNDGKETLGPRSEVNSAWSTIEWQAGQSLANVARIGLRWRVPGDWTGRLGVDNVRVGSADALTTAYSVAYGPFTTREVATDMMKTFESAGVKSFPIYEQGWYLNMGTFSTRAAAQKEASRLKGEGINVVVLVR